MRPLTHTRTGVPAVAAALCLWAAPASAHPVPFSYLDLRLSPGAIDASLVLHVIDVVHELGLEAAEALLDQELAAAREADIARLLSRRLGLDVNGARLEASWSGLETLPDRQALRLSAHVPLDEPVGTLAVDGVLFPYDPQHRTFVNVYEGGDPTQAILDAGRTRFEYFAGTRQGAAAVVRKFVPAGIHHILIGPDHILFLVGLLLLGGSFTRLALIVTGFTLAHSVTLSLAALNLVNPPASFIEPAIALSIVFVGADNLLKKDGRDVRAWIAFGFGLIHGFGFANVLREMDLPARALGWSLFSFNVGVEIAQLAIVAAVAAGLAAVRSRSEVVGRRLAWAGSVTVIAAGTFWFAERVMFSGGL
jgi:hydrogenase/urease accessory protein HupE